MNNDYDREEVKPNPDNYDEMVAAGYEMSGEGFWIPRDEDGVIDISVNPLPVVKLVVFLNGEQVLAEIAENMDGVSLTLKNPLGVMLQGVTDAGDDGEYQSTVSYGAWLPLAADRDIVVQRSSIIAICDPIPSLVESYLEGING